MTTQRDKIQAARIVPRLYLFTPLLDETATLTERLAATLSAADVATVLVRLAEGTEQSMIAHLKGLAPIAQDRGAALLIEEHFSLAARSGADGAHLRGLEALTSALPILKPERIAGTGALYSRHDAMLAGEAGADYVMFGEPDAEGRRPPFNVILERVVWWAELFEPPCVGFATSLAEAGALAAAGADFIAVDDLVWDDAKGPAAAIAAVATAMREHT